MRPFDLIMTWGKGFVSGSIEAATHGGPSHVRVYVKGLFGEFETWEVTYPRTRFGFLDEIKPEEIEKIEYARHSQLLFPLPLEISDKGLAEMIRLRGSLYDIGELAITQFLHAIGVEDHDNSDPDRYVCSSGAERVMTVMGFSYCPGDLIVSPQDICESEFYQVIDERW